MEKPKPLPEELRPDWALWTHMQHAGSALQAVLLSLDITPNLDLDHPETVALIDMAEAQRRRTLLANYFKEIEWVTGPDGGPILASVGALFRRLGLALPSRFPLSAGHDVGTADDCTWWRGTKGGPLAREAHARFWRGYDPKRSERRPKQDEVIGWLLERGCSHQMAKHIAAVISPEGLPSGPDPRKK